MRGCMFLGLAVALCGAAMAQELEVVSVVPGANSTDVNVNASVTVNFDRAIDTTTITATGALRVFGRSTGTVGGTYSFQNGNTTVVFIPDQPFSAGELVTVILSNVVEDTLAVAIRPGGYSFQFWTATQPSSTNYQSVEVLSTGVPSRPYGASVADLDDDGFSDLLVVNEDSDDVRVYMNKADLSGEFFPFITPTFGSGSTPSPSETADFDRDGNTDICLANVNDVNGNSVSIFLGNGDGTLGPQDEINVGVEPTGIAVLDVNGDGFVEIITANRATNNISLLTNDGTGQFGPASSFEGGCDQERAIATGDMNNDGLLDIVVGCRFSQNVSVRLNDGAGGFVAAGPATAAGGQPWQMALGDLNSDGLLDVAFANRVPGNGAFILNTGGGILGAPSTVSAPDAPVAIDLGDFNGDGDLDAIISEVFGDWLLFRNNGSGAFTFDQALPAIQGASCAVLFDIDNNQTLDLALIDEFDNSVQVLRGAPVTLSLRGVIVLAAALLTVAVGLGLRRRRFGRAIS